MKDFVAAAFRLSRCIFRFAIFRVIRGTMLYDSVWQHMIIGSKVRRVASSAMRLSVITTLALLIFPAFVFAQSSASPPAKTQSNHETPNLTGFWALRFDSLNVPKAPLLPGITQKIIDAHYQTDMHTVRWCQYVGMPYMMESQAPLDILQGKTQIVIVSETPSAVRHIYTDRNSHPDPLTFDAVRNGNSIGHWEGDTLLVDTTGFNDQGYTTLPGGGFRTPTSHLKERYRLVEDGKELEVTFTWEDPKVFAKPHTYAFRYYRVPRGYNAGEDFCDSNDQERSQFLTQPPLAVK